MNKYFRLHIAYFSECKADANGCEQAHDLVPKNVYVHDILFLFVRVNSDKLSAVQCSSCVYIWCVSSMHRMTQIGTIFASVCFYNFYDVFIFKRFAFVVCSTLKKIYVIFVFLHLAKTIWWNKSHGELVFPRVC